MKKSFWGIGKRIKMAGRQNPRKIVIRSLTYTTCPTASIISSTPASQEILNRKFCAA